MKNLFYYTRKEVAQPQQGDIEPRFMTIESWFNLDKVIMAVRVEGDKLAVVMDDYHEVIEEVPAFNAKGVRKGIKMQHRTHQTIITLEEEDAAKFIALTKANVE